MAKYDYKCNACGHTYVEHRPQDQSQIVTMCNACFVEEYVEVK